MATVRIKLVFPDIFEPVMSIDLPNKDTLLETHPVIKG